MSEYESQEDIRDIIFRNMSDYMVTSAVSNTREGIIYGIDAALTKARLLGLEVVSNVQDGMYIRANETIMMLRGTPKQTAMAEEVIIGILSKASGVATAAKQATELAAGKVEIVCGSFKKLPQEIRIPLRHAVMRAGVKIRIAPSPFVYLDKNYIRMFGNVAKALDETSILEEYTKVIQIRNEHGLLQQEVIEACEHGANILMIDTGHAEDIEVVIKVVSSIGKRENVKIAFAGDVKIKDVPTLCKLGVDIICIGRDIADAPLLDMKFDVIQTEERQAETNFSMNLLEKSELWIEKIAIENVNLNLVAKIVAGVLGLNQEDVLVVDVRSNHITLDILRKTVDASQIAGKERTILLQLGKIEGFHITEDSFIHSNGVLGLIALDPEEVEEVLHCTYEVGKTIQQAFEKRACIFPTGFEVQDGMIEDTNSPFISELLKKEGYETQIMPPISDNCLQIRHAIENAMNEGYSLIITTGGVGAEDKDFTVEAVLELDPYAAVPWLVKYQKGTGRHVKEGIRIAVGEINKAKIISLPGPNDEVKIAMDVLISNLNEGFNKYKTAQQIATVLRQKIQKSWQH